MNLFDMFNPFYSKTKIYPSPKRKGLSGEKWNKRKKARKEAKKARKRKN